MWVRPLDILSGRIHNTDLNIGIGNICPNTAHSRCTIVTHSKSYSISGVHYRMFSLVGYILTLIGILSVAISAITQPIVDVP